MTYGLVLGLVQSATIGRSLREILTWATLTAVIVPLAGFGAFIPVFFVSYALFHEWWIAGALFGLVIGAAVGGAQGALFYAWHAPRHVVLRWTLGNSVAAVVVGAIAFAASPTVCGPQGTGGAALGALFGLLTAPPLAKVLRELSSDR